MGFMDELKKLTKPYSEEPEGEYDEYDEEEEVVASAPAQPAPSASRRSSPFSASASESRAATQARRPAPTASSNLVNLNNGTNLQLVLVKPDRFDNVSEIADHLREKKAIVLNLESTNKDVARRLVDFLSGCAYSLDGKIKKVAISTYIITPFNVDVVGDLVEELENSGMYF